MAIEIFNIHKYFDKKHILKGIDFLFEDKKVNMIIGTSGSGKTVLVKCIVGLLIPEEGKVLYDGQDFLTAPPKVKREIRRNIGMLFQSSALFDSMTVGENVAFPLRIFTKMSEQEIRKRVQYCLERVDLHNVEHLYPSEISGGMKKRVGIARAIVMNPKYLFFDEPNSGLDPKTATLIDELIRELTQEMNTTTVVITHDIRSVFMIGDKILFLYKGKKEWEGTPDQIENCKNEALLDFIDKSGVSLTTSLKKNK